MPMKNGRYTRSEVAFIKDYAMTGSRDSAAGKAGYASPQAAASKLLANPHILEAIAAEQKKIIVEQVLPLAVKRHLELLQSDKTPGAVQIQAIKLAYERGLIDGAGADKPLSEMTAEELAALRQRVLSKMSELATPIIDAKPVDQVGGGVFD